MKTVVYLINLNGSNERLASAHKQLAYLGVDYIRVPAFDGRGKGLDEFNFVDKLRMWQYLGRNLSGGEIGCYLSHVECAKRFLLTDAEICIVLEDDILIPNPASIKILLNSINYIPNGWHIINFGNQKNKIYSLVKKIDTDSVKTSLVKAHYFPMTTTGICWSREGAQAFLNEAFPIFVSVDRFLRHWQTRVGQGYCFMPPLVTTTGVDSDINRPSKTIGLSFQNKAKYGLKKQSQMITDKFIAYFNKIKS